MAKKKVIVAEKIETREQMERLVGEICILTIKNDEEHTHMDRDLTVVRERYEPRLLDLQEKLENLMASAQDWAINHPEEFATKKSVAMVHGTVGFRTGNWKLKPLSGWTWDKVLKAVTAYLPKYIRTKIEVDREQLIADRETLTPAGFKKIGLTALQDETFYVEPNREGGAQ